MRSYSGAAGHAEQAFAPIRRLGVALADTVFAATLRIHVVTTRCDPLPISTRLRRTRPDVHNPHGLMEAITLRHLLTHSAGLRAGHVTET